MPAWSIDDWKYIERETVSDSKGNRWTIALMDALGQEGEPGVSNQLPELQSSSGRYFTLIYSASGALQREQGYALLSEAATAYEDLLMAVIDGTLDPSQAVLRENSEE
jgi:hypothetical protein